ncbi:hypothetical protein TSAR_003713 [Trichomalopsis sarcophagae]|uniref:RBR-type E3 ubiquitin transferase n=1 Tax=Trichomalopsis sarcophagae TaxID=543379 RepID=A0A232ENL0_9HYME|nr:hypothetical protein TSAR_003713 [Trichomalopsis sarcophagae]
MSDLERQDDEIFAIENICSPNQFRYKKKTNIECFFSVSCELANENVLIDYKNVTKKVYIKYLPPVRLYVQLPKDYPSASPPKYNIAINWLTPWQVSLTCQKLDKLWQRNESNEILFIWLEFLKSDLLNFLHIEDILEVSYLMELYENPDDEFLLEVLNWTDERVVYGGLFLNPIERLKEYNESRDRFEFESQFHLCDICFCTSAGQMCIRVDGCNHAFCKACILQYLTMKINERYVLIQCPAADCKVKMKCSQIRGICSTELFQKYEEYLFEKQILNMKKLNLVYCPRRFCQKAVYVKIGESLASCPACEYNFCAFCFKVYHGVSACEMDSKEKLQLIKEYESADLAKKKFLDKKYGRHQIRQIVEKQLTNEYLQKNTKACPTCGVVTAKLTGCNLMTCSHCHSQFCWLCNSKIVSNDEYEHFKSTTNGPCSGRLFEPIDNQIDDFDPEVDNGYDIVPNWNLDMFLNMLHARH